MFHATISFALGTTKKWPILGNGFFASPLRQVQSLNQCLGRFFKIEGQIPVGYQSGYIYIYKFYLLIIKKKIKESILAYNCGSLTISKIWRTGPKIVNSFTKFFGFEVFFQWTKINDFLILSFFFSFQRIKFSDYLILRVFFFFSKNQIQLIFVFEVFFFKESNSTNFPFWVFFWKNQNQQFFDFWIFFSKYQNNNSLILQYSKNT
jgi:hypothetical protein